MDPEKEPLDEWDEYRSISLAPGGFGENRVDIWSKVLHATPQDVKEYSIHTEPSSHPDERQIRLDTERSFVLYPIDSKTDKDKLQAQLNDLLVKIFHKRPKLNYFQGYHDIITVLLLTLPRELQMPCAEQLSLQRVRDSMGSTLEPVLGLLRFMQNLLRMADPQFAELLERTSPLPYYALPNLLTLFSHDMPTLPLIQHVFDYLLCRPPIYVVYLAAAIILCRKQEVERLEEGEEGMMHSILSALPEILDDDSSAEPQPKEEPLADDFALQSKKDLPPEEVLDVKQDPQDPLVSLDESSGVHASETAVESRADVPIEQEASADPDLPLSESTTGTKPELPASDPSVDDSDSSDIHASETAVESRANIPIAQEASAEPDSPLSESTTGTKPELPVSDPSVDDSDSATINRRKVWKPKAHTLAEILNMSDALYKTHPPTNPFLQLRTIMGPQSTIFTWSPRVSDMPSDDEAERIVERLDLVVYPAPPLIEPKERDTEVRRRKRLKKTTGAGSVGLLIGAGLVLSVAVAISVYGARQGGDPTRGWRKLGRWVGGVLAGASERVIGL
ncbi:rab-GTPase-TBC domain-containing protein [Mycena sanguinolenta]|nr:rab-GTPase-TBC domain-containing protein [Mycena sanguinolenta]